MIEEVTFNGVTLSDFYQVAGVVRPMPARRVTTEQISGMDGNRIIGATFDSLTITVHLIVDGGVEDRRDAIRRLLPLLQTDRPAPLVFASDNGLYYMAMFEGEAELTEHVANGRVSVNFLTEEPILYGEEHSVTVPSGGSVEIQVDGTYPTYPKIEGYVYGDQNTNIWGVTLDDGRHLHVNTGTTSERAIMIDCADRVTKLANQTHLPTLDSDWFELTRGSHTIENTIGSGDCTFSWQERWL